MNQKFQKIFILTGAGISAESGIKTFRDADGLWEDHRIEDVATPEAFIRNPELVHRFYNLRRRQLFDVTPNLAHEALASFEKNYSGDFLLVTQNVDDLHERAGSKKLLHMHGQLRSVFCQGCGDRKTWERELSVSEICTYCDQKGSLRPDIVWFGEMPYHMEKIYEFLEKCDLFLSIGTSGQVYPAAAFVREATDAHKIEINIKASEISHLFDENYWGTAGDEVPKFISTLKS